MLVLPATATNLMELKKSEPIATEAVLPPEI